MPKQAPSTVEVDITSSAMLVELSISTWTGRKSDRRASAKVTEEANAKATHAVRVNKDILGDCAELKAINKHVGDTRNNIHYHLTLPWSDSGIRLVPTQQFFGYNEEITGAQNKFDALVKAFLDVYDQKVEMAAEQLGSLFNPDDYPTKENVESRFDFKVNYMPLPSSGDFRVDIGNEALEAVQSSYKDYYESQMNAAMSDLWERLYKNLDTLIRQLDVNEEGKPNRLYESVFERVQELTEMLGTCNINQDSQMTALKERLEESLYGLTVESLKDSFVLRKQKRKELESAIKQLPSLDW